MKTKNHLKKLDSLREIALKGEKLLIVIYQNPDPDALGSALALRKLLKKTGENCTIAYTGKISRPENEFIIKLLRIPVEEFRESMLSSYDLLAVVDAQPSFFKESPFLGSANFNIVVDHHPRQKGYTADFVDIRPSYGATSTIMTEYMRQTRTKLTASVATALYYGLDTDTAGLQRVASNADIDAFKYLRKRANMNVIRKVNQSHFPLRSLEYFGVAIMRKHVVGDIIFAHLGNVEASDVCVQIADFFMEIYEIGWAIVSGISEDTLVITMRCDGFKKNVGKLAEKVFGPMGSAGGHRTMARAEIALSELKKKLQKTSNEAIEEFLVENLSKSLKPLRRIRLH